MFFALDVNSLKNPFLSFWVILKNLIDSCIMLETQQGNHKIFVTTSFTESSIFKMFSVHTKTQSSN